MSHHAETRGQRTVKHERSAGASRYPPSAVVATVAVACFVVGTFAWHRLTPPDNTQVAAKVRRSGPLVEDDMELESLLAGSAKIDATRAAQTAFCVNGWYWATDETLDLRVVVSTSERFLRVAEIATGNDFPYNLIIDVETDLIESGAKPNISEVSLRIRQIYGDEAVSDYLKSTSTPVSETNRSRFVVYAVNETMTRQFIYFIDTDHIDKEAISRFVAEPGLKQSYTVQISGGATVSVDPDACVSDLGQSPFN